MKKFFTLIAAVAMAASMNAQTETVVIPALADGVKSQAYAGEKTLKTVNAQIEVENYQGTGRQQKYENMRKL